MVLTADRVRAFFRADDWMEIPVATITQLVREGIEHPYALQDIDKDSPEGCSEQSKEFPEVGFLILILILSRMRLYQFHLLYL